MLEKTLRLIQKLIPKEAYRFFQPAYHFTLAVLGTIIYRYPSKQIHVIGVTGTKGKSSTCEFLSAILDEANKDYLEKNKKGEAKNYEKNKYKSALLSTIRFKIGDASHPNMYKMTMPGRFFMQKFLRQAVDSGCKYAVVEMTSEGAKNYRHIGVSLDTLIFTNLSPEHIESHGGFENYKACKLRLAKAVENSGKKVRTIVANVSDEYGTEFLDFDLDKKVKYTEEEIKDIKLSVDGSFNKLNALAAKKLALSIGISEDIIDKALLDLKVIPGRVQHINVNNKEQGFNKQTFEVIVDYAHTEDSLEKLYKTYGDNYIIGVLGACGGGRDTAKRSKLGSAAYSYCNEIIITDEDPYDDDPRKIMEDVASGVINFYDKKNENKYKIIENRREAINYAISRANKYINTLPLDMIKAANIMPQKPIVIISGKGTDPYIMRANNKREKWSDAKVAEEELRKVLS